MSVTRQRHGEDSPGVTLSAIGHPLLGNGPINTHSRTADKVFSVESVLMNYKSQKEFRGW
jgi:hypothetical protein